MKRILIRKFVAFLKGLDKETKGTLFFEFEKAAQDIIYDQYRVKYEIDKSFRFNGVKIVLYGPGKIVCGVNSYIGNYSTIQAGNGCKVEIGKNCSISHNVRIYTSSNIADQDFNSNESRKKINKDVIIGDGVWIGTNVYINPGITIGSNSVVGANSVVTKSIPANSIFAGVPAKLIKNKN